MLISNLHLELGLDVVHACFLHQAHARCEFVAVVVVHCLLHFFPMLVRVGLSQALFVDLRDKRVAFPGVGGKVSFKLSDLLVHLCLVFERVFVQNLVLFFACVHTLLKALIVLKLCHNVCFGIIGAHRAVLYVDFVDLALFNQPLVLVITNRPFLASLEFLPRLFLDHGCVCVQVLTLKLDLLQFFGQSFLLILFVSFLLADVVIGL
jgi:hypothetical protein